MTILLRGMLLLLLAGGLRTGLAATCTSNASGNWSSNAIWSGCSGGPGPNDDVVIANGHTVTVNVNNARCRTLTINPGNQNSGIIISGNNTLRPSRDLIVNSDTAGISKSVNVGAGTLDVGRSISLTASTGAGIALVNATTGTITVGGGPIPSPRGASGSASVAASSGNLTVTRNVALTASGAGSNTAVSTATGPISIGGTLTVTSTGTSSLAELAVAQGSLQVNNNSTVRTTAGTGTSRISVTSGNISFGGGATRRNLTLNSNATGRIAQLQIGTGTVTVTGNLTSNNGPNREQVIFTGSGLLNIGGNYTSGGELVAATGTVRFDGNNINQSIGAYTYNNLIIDNTGNRTATAAGNIGITGDFTHNGNFSPGSCGSRTVTFNGTAPQNINGSATNTDFCRLTIDNTAAAGANRTVTLGHDITIIRTGSSSLIFNNGRIVTGTHTVIINGTNASAVSGAAGAPDNRFVAGNLRKNIPNNASTRNFEVGAQSPTPVYASVTVQFVSGTTGGTLTVSTTSGDHPNIATSGLNPSRDVNRYWTLTAAGIALPAAGYRATFNFVAADLDPFVNTSNLVVRRYVAPNWSTTTIGTRTATSTQALALGGFGDFAIGELGGIDHFAILHDGSAINCQPEPITIQAHLASHAVSASFTGTVSLTTSTGHGDWSIITGGGTLDNGAANDGAASYAFAAADAGSVVLGLRDTFVETVNINVTDGSVDEHSGSALASEDADLVYAEAGFQFLANGVADAIGTQIAGKDSSVAPGAQTLELQAIKTGPPPASACEAALVGPANIDLALSCDDPATCNLPIAINGTAISGSYTPVSLDFGDATDSTATLVLNYPDAGRIHLNARYNLPLGNGTPSGNFMVGSSNPFVVRPFGFDIDFSGDRKTNGTGGISYAADANGSRFVKAGANFATTVTAVTWQAGDDADNNGVPDTGASLADNAATPNFGLELAPETVNVTHTRVSPTGPGAQDGILTGGSAIGGFSNGAATTNLAWDEVGILDLQAGLTSGNYLGSGADVIGVVSNVGRFYPDRFAVVANTPDFAHGCPGGEFTYMDQTFYYDTAPVLTITALNTAGGVTRNYGGSGAERFWKFSGVLPGRSYSDTAAPATLSTLLNGAVTLGGDTDFDGEGTLTLTAGSGGDGFVYTRGTAPVAPFNPAVEFDVPAADLTDSDGVCYDSQPDGICDNFRITGIKGSGSGTMQQRFGRLTITSVSGSELLPLTVPLRTEYYNGSTFVTNSDDNCTVLPLATAIRLRNPSTAGGADQPGTATMTIPPAGSVSAQPPLDVSFAAGAAGLTFGPAPGADNTGYVEIQSDLNAAAMRWLLFNWDGIDQLGDGILNDDDPLGRASFGIYPGSNRYIYQREPW